MSHVWEINIPLGNQDRRLQSNQFHGISNNINIFFDYFYKVMSKISYSLDNLIKFTSSQPTVTVSSWSVFRNHGSQFQRHNTYEKSLIMQTSNFPLFDKNSNFHFSFFKEDSQNPILIQNTNLVFLIPQNGGCKATFILALTISSIYFIPVMTLLFFFFFHMFAYELHPRPQKVTCL